MADAEHYLRRGLFVPSDREKLERNGFLVYSSLGRTHRDFQTELQFAIASDLEAELIERTREKPAHPNELASEPQLFIPESANLPLAQQDERARIHVRQLRQRYKLVHVAGGISRITDYEEVILQHLQKRGIRLLEAEKYLYPSARTRTRVFLDRVDPLSYLPIIGPYSETGLRIDTLARDEADNQVGVWVLLYPSLNPQ